MRKKLILASQSPRRKELLHRMGLTYTCIVPKAPEVSYKKKPSALVKELAYNKVYEVWCKDTKGVILGADTIVVCKGEIIGKPQSIKDAERILKLLTHNIHFVYTGIAVIDTYTKRTYRAYEKTAVKLRRMSVSQIKHFAQQHPDKAGGYAIQEDGDELVEYIRGDYYNVVGLPLKKTITLLNKCGIIAVKTLHAGG